MRMQIAFAALALVVAPAGVAFATDYYVAPPGTAQSCTADGSQACPWIGLDAAFGSGMISGGDTIFLLDGDYGPLVIKYQRFAAPVIIKSLNVHNAHIDYAYLQYDQYITLSGLSVWWKDPHVKESSDLVAADSTASNIVFDNLDVRGGEDAATYPTWDINEWTARYVNGAVLYSPNSIVQNSKFTGVAFGIEAMGEYSQIIGNTIDGFSGDGMRVGRYGKVIGNRVTNCVSINDNHADGFQSFTSSPTNPVTGLDIEDNTIIQWTQNVNDPLACKLQGIGMFDGYYDDLTIRNNVISVTMGHGITVYGARNAVIENNTVVNNEGLVNSYPWIMVAPLKDGSPSQNVVVANNLAMSFNVTPDPTNNIVMDSNSVILDPSTTFTDISTFDYTPGATSGFIDTANPAYAPATDVTGAPRPFGVGPDRGAYEVGSTTTSTTGGTATGGGVKKISHGSAKFLTPPGQAKK